MANVNCEIPEDFLSAVVLNGLPAEYDVSVEVLRSNHETLTLSQALEPMMNTEHNIENRSENPSEVSSSTFLTHKGKKTKSNLFCRYCKKKGHTIEECRLKKKADQKKSGEESMIALMASSATTTTTNPNFWVVDSGASQHMTPHRQLVVTVAPVLDMSRG